MRNHHSIIIILSLFLGICLMAGCASTGSKQAPEKSVEFPIESMEKNFNPNAFKKKYPDYK